MVCFNNHKRDDLWGPSEWEFFLDDVRANLLKPGGQLNLELNPEHDGRFMTPEVEQVFVSAGGWVRGGVVRVPAIARERRAS